MSELKELIEKYIELEEQLDNLENEEEADEELLESLHELGHEIDHAVFHEEFTIVYNADTEDEEVVALIVPGEEEGQEEFFIPVFTSEDEAKKAIKTFIEESGEANFACDKAVGSDIVQAYSEDEEFLGLAVDAPQCDFVIFAESVHDCSE